MSLYAPANKTLIKNVTNFEETDLIWIQGRIKELNSADKCIRISDISGEIMVRKLSTKPDDATYIFPEMLNSYCMVIGYLQKNVEPHIKALKVTILSKETFESIHEQMWPLEVLDVTRRGQSTSQVVRRGNLNVVSK
ncbi:hypothetical protein CHUAL_006289 [Chamberlinius hualienensis]